MRLIDADELLLNNTWLWYDENGNHTIVGEAIENAPTVDAELVRHGHWIEYDVGLICSECNHYTEAMYDEPFNNEFGIGWALKRPFYCGYCGAKMDEVET